MLAGLAWGWVRTSTLRSLEEDEANRVTRMCVWSGATKKNAELRNRKQTNG
jgi:hypothetical protein